MAKTFLDATGLSYAFTRIKSMINSAVSSLNAEDIGAAKSDHTHSAASTSAAGFMSASDKTKLDGIASGATKVTVDASLSSTSTNPVQNKVINSALSGKAASSHNHAAGDITSGTLPVARGGTGVTSNPSMMTNLASGTAASVFAANPRPGVVGTLGIGNGGTGGTTAATARAALGITPANIGAVPTSRTVNGKALSANITLSASNVGAVAKNEDIVIQKSGVAYESIFGQGTRNTLLRVRNTAGNANNQRTIALFDSTQRPDLETAVRLYDVIDGTEKIYSLFGEHNLELLADSLASQGLKSATVTATWTASGGYFYQDVTVSGITSADTPVIDILPGSDNAANVLYSEAICKVFRITTSTDSVRVWATEAITTAFPIRIKVV